MTSQQHSKHPDWDELWQKMQNDDWDWLEDYNESHDINQCTDEQGNTLLHCVVPDEHLRAIPYLSYLPIDANIKNAAGQTALQLQQDTDPDCLGDLHRYHFCIDFVNASIKPNGLDALFAAIYRGDATLGDTSGVKDDGNERNEGGWTALHCAAMYDRPHLIRELHQRFPKLDADCLNYEECSVLRIAAMYGHSNCIIALCECFPAMKARDALHAACEHNRSAFIPILRMCFPQLTGNELTNNYRFNSALMRAVFKTNPECIRVLHSCFPDIDPNLQDPSGNTALFAAAQYPQSLNCISVLFECFPDIDPNKQDNNYGNTALMYACKQGLPQSITSLATYFPSIDANVRNKAGKTALMLAIPRKNENYLTALCESFPNIDPNTQDKDQNTALMYLLKPPKCSVESARHFLDTFPDVNVNIQNNHSETALTLAIEKGNAPVVALLLQRFPDISFISWTEETALMLAIKKNDTNLISMLLKHISQLD